MPPPTSLDGALTNSWRGYELPTRRAEVLGLPEESGVRVKILYTCLHNGHKQAGKISTSSSNWLLPQNLREHFVDEKRCYKTKSTKKRKLVEETETTQKFNKQENVPLLLDKGLHKWDKKIHGLSLGNSSTPGVIFSDLRLLLHSLLNLLPSGSIRACGPTKMVSGWRKYVPLGKIWFGVMTEGSF